jgi:hypothetical protein
MQNDLIFKTGSAKRTLGWLVFLGSAGALIALIYAIFTHPEAQIPSELWSAAAIGAFLIGLMITGISIQHVRWIIEDENIIFHGLFRTRTIPISRLAGFGYIVIVTNLIPFVHLDLYDHTLKHVARLPVSIKDWPRAEEWLSGRFRHVTNDGGQVFAKYRFSDTPKI